jgi:hypothetical protein
MILRATILTNRVTTQPKRGNGNSYYALALP